MKFTYQSKYYLLSIKLFVSLWEVISIKLNDDFLMPRLKQIFIKCFELIREDNFLADSIFKFFKLSNSLSIFYCYSSTTCYLKL